MPARFEDLSAQHARYVGTARDSVELRPGDIVLAQIQQSTEAIPLFWRCMAAGAVFAPIDPAWPAYIIERAVAAISPRAIVADTEQLATLSEIFPDAAAVHLADGLGQRFVGAALNHSPDAPAAYLFTSGSTGTPKAVVHSRRSLATSAALVLETFRWCAGDRLLNLPEPHTMSGLRNALIAAPMGGLEWLSSPAAARSNFFELVERIHESRCDHLVAGPSFVRQLAGLGDRLPADQLAGVKAIYCTGAALSASSSREVYRRFRIPVVNYYGLTETGGLCLSQDRDRWDPDDDSLGRPVGCEARLVGVGGDMAEEGELQIRSGQQMIGYLNDAEATADRLVDGWLRTGDVMCVDDDGRYRLRGRADLFIKTRSTDRVHPEEIESVLELHPDVAEAAVVGIPDQTGGELVLAMAVLDRRAAQDAGLPIKLANFVVEKLGPSRKPSELRFVSGLPRLPSGKLDRAELKRLVT